MLKTEEKAQLERGEANQTSNYNSNHHKYSTKGLLQISGTALSLYIVSFPVCDLPIVFMAKYLTLHLFN